MFHFFHSEFADKIFEPRFEIVRRFKAALLSRVDVTEIDRRNKTFIHLAKRRYFLDSPDLRRFSHRFRAEKEVAVTRFLNERSKGNEAFFGEGDRWFELKRNGMPTWRIINDATGIYQKYTMEEYMYTFPINKDDTELKDYIKQNEGYVEYSSK